MQRWAIILAACLAGCLCLLAWRESGHRKARSAQLEQMLALQAELNASAEERTVLQKRIKTAEAAFEEGDIARQGLSDRVTNLEAQRDHLRAEVDRQEARARKAEESIAAAHLEVEHARKQLLEQGELPRQLQSRLSQAEARVAELEDALDADTATAADFPEMQVVEGVATDGQVVAVTGELPEGAELPCAVYLCKRDRVVLEAWIARMEEGIAIAHVEKWRDPASKLVKGEKVFILPVN